MGKIRRAGRVRELDISATRQAIHTRLERFSFIRKSRSKKKCPYFVISERPLYMSKEETISYDDKHTIAMIPTTA